MKKPVDKGRRERKVERERKRRRERERARERRQKIFHSTEKLRMNFTPPFFKV